MKTALILSGGGARAAYQVGVLKGLAEIIPPTPISPFQIICGTSAGAINAAMLASQADQFQACAQMLEKLWSGLHTKDVYEGSFYDLLRSGTKLLASLFQGGFGDEPLALLNSAPLRELLARNINFSRIAEMIERGNLHALGITAIGYTSGQSISFCQGRSSIKPWQRSRRIGVLDTITLEHLLASAAIPTIFPAQHLHREYFGDGAIRQVSPISPALHLGADRVVVIGVSGNVNNPIERAITKHAPSMAQIMAQLLNSAFIDAMESDVELLERFNRVLSHVPVEKQKELKMRPVELLSISPSIKFDSVAAKHVRDLPNSMRWFMKMVGATRYGGGASMASYLLFESKYCVELIAAGYADALNQKEDILRFMSIN